MPTCMLIRHGRTTSNADGVLAGWTPGVGLDERGRQQVQDLADRLVPVPMVRLVTSPLQRCVETAGIIATVGDVAPEQEPRIGECRYGAWTGRPIKELAEDPLWRVVQDQPSAARFPDSADYEAESLQQMQARALEAVRDHDAAVRAEHGEHAVWALVSHGDVIKSVLADAAGAHLDQFQRFLAGPASLSAVHYAQRRPFVLRINDTGSDLSWLKPPEEGAAAGDDAVPEGDAAVGGGVGADARGAEHAH
ncbi:MAG TPA: MSMEG_4193 family putative phosphomutase [Segeticoccus sp.]|nr:MSMEG_4193 family putative phosphomutase [Segeticoccus sp.]